jgi:K+-sensing histidine kinase KdpD
MVVAVVIVGRIQSVLSQARASERDAIFMYELSAALASLRTQGAVAHTLARQLEQMFQASLVKVILQSEGQSPSYVVSEPRDAVARGKPDRILPILNAWGLVGEIQLWHGYGMLPPEDGRLLQNFASQAAQALERTRLAEAEDRVRALAPAANVKSSNTA